MDYVMRDRIVILIGVLEFESGLQVKVCIHLQLVL